MSAHANFEKRHADGLMLAIGVMSAIVEAYDHNGQDPDTTLADYITDQSIGDVSPATWNLLSGFANLVHGFLIDDEQRHGIPKQTNLDLWEEAVKKMAPP